MLTITPGIKKAGCGGHQQPAASYQQSTYHCSHPPVKGTRQKFPGRLPAQPRPAASPDGATVGLLLLLLSAVGNELSPSQARQGWALAARWASAYVAACHASEAA
jgi:hypothetical protein